MNRARVLLALLTALTGTSFAQHSITLTSPTSGQVIQSPVYGQWPTVHPTATVVDASGNSTAHVLYLFNGKPFADNVNISYIRNTGDPNWTATFNPALYGDGTGTMQAISYDIFGNQLAQSSIVSFQLRVSGDAVGLVDTVQTSGAGTFRATINVGVGSSMNGQLFIDGRISDAEWQTGQGGWANGPTDTVKTYRFLNGPHEVLYATGNGAASFPEPFVMASSFTNSAVSGSSITATGHFFKSLEPVVFSTTGTLPSPLIAGTAWYWATSSASFGSVGNANTFTASVSSGVMTITTNSAHGISPGAQVYVFNAVIGTASYQQSGNGAVQLCDGLYSAVTASGSTITLNTPSCPNGNYNPQGMEIYTNVYFTNYIDNSTVSVSATPGGSAITLSTAGASGTHKITGRPMWNPQISNGFRLANNGSPNFFAYQSVTFANGTMPMELHPAFAEMHGVAGTTGPSLCSGLMTGTTGSMVFNTDGTSTTINCNAVTYTPVTDFVAGVVTVDANGYPTFVNPGWTHVIVACAACAAGGTFLPSVNVWIQVHSGSVTFPHFTINGVTSTYVSGQSLYPRVVWNIDPYGFLNPGIPAASKPLYIQPMLQLANINTVQSYGPAGIGAVDPANHGPCGAYPLASDTARWNWVRANPYVRTIQSDDSNLVLSSGYGIDAVLNNVNWTTSTRQACYAAYWAAVSSAGLTSAILSEDEINNNFAGTLLTHDFTGAGPSSLIGSTFFNTFTTNGAGLATITGQIDLRSSGYVWNQSTGVGEYVRLNGSSISSLNNVYPILSVTGCNQSVLEGLYCAMTIQTTCVSCTRTSSNDPTLELVHWDTVIAGRNCVVPALVGISDTTQIGWGGSHGPTSVVSDGATPSNLTVNWTGHGFLAGQVLHIFSATNIGLNLYSIVGGVTTNSFTVVALTTVTAGTYNISTDASAQFTRDCDFPNNTYTTLRTFLKAAPAPPQILTPIGTTYGKAFLPSTWSYIGNSANTDAVLRYHASSNAPIYSFDQSVYGNATALNTESLTARPWQIGPLGDLFGSGGFQGAKFHSGFVPDFRYDRILSIANIRPENISVSIGHGLSLGDSHLKLYLFNGSVATLDYPAAYGGGMGLTSINPNTTPVQWASWSWGFAFLQMLSKYLLQPQMNTPYLGPMFSTSAHTSSFGNILTIACLNETPYQQTVNLAPYRLTGGSSYRVSLTGYRLTVTALAGNPTSDTYNLCGHGPGSTQSPGETVAYVFQPSGAISDIVNQQFSAPASPLPYGASKFLIRYGYFGRGMVEGQDPIIDCTTGCTVPINNANVNAFYQTIYADSTFKSLASGDPIMLTAVNPNP